MAERVSIKCLTDEDLYRLPTVYSETNFDVKTGDRSVRKVDLSSQTNFSKIKLIKPVINHVISNGVSGQNSVLARYLNLRAEWDSILSGSLGLKRSNPSEGLVSISAGTASVHDYIVGIDCIMYYIDHFNADENIIEQLKILCHTFLKDAKFENYQITTEVTDIHVVDRYYIKEITDGYVATKLQGQNFVDAFYNACKSKSTAAKTLFDYLNSPRDNGFLKSMLQSYIVVIPTALRLARAMTNVKQHPLTELYKKVMKANARLMSLTTQDGEAKNCTVEEYINSWNILNNAVLNLQVANVRRDSVFNKGKGNNAGDQALMEHISHKHGQIREYNFGKRQDYSARTVVTISPYLSLDRINIPAEMVPSLYFYHALPYLMKKLREPEYKHFVFEDLTNPSVELQKLILQVIIDNKIMDRVPLYMGRQPTLHRHSFIAFYAGITDSKAIEVNPLVCPGYNMDFDGDQAHLQVPLSNKAIKDLVDKMFVTKTVFLSKNGKSTIEPRQDMLYGLYLCTRHDHVRNENPMSFSNLDSVRQAVEDNKIHVDEMVTAGGITARAGELAFMGCFAYGDVKPWSDKHPKDWEPGECCVTTITSKTIEYYINYILGLTGRAKGSYDMDARGSIDTSKDRTDTFVGCINHLVRLGFQVAENYPPSVTLVDPIKKSTIEYDGVEVSYDELNNQFYKATKQLTDYYQYGLESSMSYDLQYAREVSKLNKANQELVMKSLDPENGYVLMAKSGARGSVSNLTQIFKYIGQLTKNSSEAFQVIVEHGYYDMLTPFEHFICAYGGRQGQMDKTLKTADTGYAERRLWHVTQGSRIVSQDCGDTEGIEISYEFYQKHFYDGNEIDEEVIEEVMTANLTGHWSLDYNKYLTKEEAKNIASHHGHHRIRSVMTCKNPCCVKCYGIDTTTKRPVEMDTYVGMLAAQSIGEPATQLTMKQFQKGGVATAHNSNSAFDRMQSYTNKSDITEKPGYDPIAWASGKVTVSATKNSKLVEVQIEGSDLKRRIPRGITLAPVAEKGVGLSSVRGDYDLHEVETYFDNFRDAQLYLAAKLYLIYRNEVKIISQHFEVLVSSITRYEIIMTDRTEDVYSATGVLRSKRLLMGQLATHQDLFSGDTTNTIYKPTFINSKAVFRASSEALDSLVMENFGQGISRAVRYGLTDSLEKPFNRIMCGLTIK